MPHAFDVLCVGSAKIDIFLSIYSESPYVHLNKDVNELCVAYGQKIPVDGCSLNLGGNACNVAVGLSKLQIPTAVMAEIGKDEFARRIIDALSNEKVDTSRVLQTEGKPSSFSTILSYKGERTIFSEHVRRSHDFNFENIFAKWIYLTSLGEDWTRTYQEIVDFVKKTNCRLAFNPGTLQINSEEHNIRDVISLTDILFLNKEEAIQVLRINDKGLSTENLLRALQKKGVRIAIITDGENGSYAIDEKGNLYEQPIVKTDIVEKTGAGDAYASGFLAATLHNLPIQTAMRWGTLNASGTMAVIGAQNGLLSKAEMEKKLL